jgi:UDP-glucose 4-epimerase
LRVLVTGAAGFLGRHLLAELPGGGCEVIALVHRNRLPESLRAQVLCVLEGDVRDSAIWSDVVSQVDAVCHFAAYIPPDYEDPSHAEACFQVNSLATLEMARLALNSRKCRFIYASAGNAYAYANRAAAEESSLYPADRATYYLTSKIAGELYIEHLRRLAGLESFCFRISTPYGFGMAEKSVVAHFMRRAAAGLPLEVLHGGVSTYDFVHAEDVARLVAAALRGGEPGVYNVGSGAAHSLVELARAVADTYPGRGISIEVKPAGSLVPASFAPLSIDKATRMWGYHPMSLREGLARYRNRMEASPG